MHTLHPTLLVGPYDWEADQMPREEFAARIAALWNRITDPACTGVVVFGDSKNHAELAWLTGYVPKLRPSIAYIPRNGETVLVAPDGKGMLPSTQRRTWATVALVKDAGKSMAQWLKDNARPGKLALVGGEYIRSVLYRPLMEAYGEAEFPFAATETARELMRVKSGREITMVKKAAEILKAAADGLAAAHKAGKGITDAVNEAEHAAHRMGAQDVRTLFSTDGGMTLRPYYAPDARVADPLLAYFAVRHANYWADGFVTLASRPGAARAKAGGILTSLLPQIRAGATGRALAASIHAQAQGWRPHPMVAGSVGNAVGLTLEEEPVLRVDSDQPITAGAVLSVRIGLGDGKGDNAIVSALVQAGAAGSEVLWSSA